MSAENGLEQAWNVQQAASKVGFDWDSIDGAIQKVEEELGEVRDAASSGNPDAAREELGDLLFAVVNVSRFLKEHPNDALIAATKKFSRRFDTVCAVIDAQGRNVHECTLEELDVVWERVKAMEPERKK